MIPEKNNRCNFTYQGPNPNVADLPCQREQYHGNRLVWSFWRPTAEEIEQLKNGAVVVLGIWNHEPIPPVSLGVEFCEPTQSAPKAEQ